MKDSLRKLQSVTANDSTATATLNANFEQIENELKNTLSRDGTAPNYMDADLDLNSYKIINISEPTEDGDVATKKYVDENIGNAYGYSQAAAISASNAASYAQQASVSASSALQNANYVHGVADNILNDSNIQGLAADLASDDSVIKAVENISSDITTVAGIASNVSTVAGNSANISTVAGITSDVSTIAGIASDVSNVSQISSDVPTVADNVATISAVATNINDIETVATNINNVIATGQNIVNVNSVAGNATNINKVASDINRVNLVADDISSVHTVAVDISNVIDVADNKTNINAVAGNETNINTVANNSTNINSVATNSTNINNVAADLTNIDAVAADLTNIDAVAVDLTNIDSVAGNSTNINAVAGNATNINAVAADLTNIDAVAADLTNIDNASTYADNALIWAEGTDQQVQALGGVHSSKGWAYQSSQGQVQADWAESDSTEKSYIKNKGLVLTSANAGTDISITSTSQVDINSGNGSATASNAASINYIKLSGGCTLSATPTLTSPADIICNNGTISIDSLGNIVVTGTTETVTDSLGGTATASMLLGVDGVADIQDIISGDISRNVGIKVFDGTEYNNWTVQSNRVYALKGNINIPDAASSSTPISTHVSSCEINTYGNVLFNFDTASYNITDATSWNNWLAAQYANGTPLILIYRKASASSDSVAGQTLSVKGGTDTFTITQSSIPNLPIEVSTNSEGIGIINFSNTTGYITGSDIANMAETNAAQSFSADQTFQAHVYKQSTTMDLDDPSGIIGDSLDFTDKNGVIFGYIQAAQFADGTVQVGLAARGSSTNSFSEVSVYQLPDGTAWTIAPTPATSDNSTKIATTAFVKNAAITKANTYYSSSNSTLYIG